MRNLFRRIGAVALALCLLLTTLPTAVLAEGLDGVTDVSDKVVYNSQSTYYYDGNPVTFSPRCEGITEWDVRYLDGTGGALGYAPSGIGSYSVQMTGKGTDCYASVTHSFRIVEGQIAYSVSDYSGAYDGQAHSIGLSVTTPGVAAYYLGPNDSEYSPTLPTFTTPGTYTISYMLEKESYETVTGSATVTISKATIAYSIGGFDGTDAFSVEYDGQPHSISVNVDISDVDVRYATSYEGPYSAEMPSFTEAGQYVVYFTLEKQNYETVEGSVTIEITPADVSSQVKLSAKEFYTYTGEPVVFNPVCAGIDSWTYAYYQDETPLDAAPTAVGSYRVEITGEGANCYAEVEHSYSILAADIAYTADGYTGVYDGEAHSITVEVATAGATVTYTASLDEPYTEMNPTFTDAGEYPVWFKIEKDNYANVGGCKIVSIAKADASAQVSFDGQASYAYTGSPVAFNPVCAVIDSWTYTYYENDTQLDAAPIAPGSYRVEISGEGKNHTAQLSHSYSIVAPELPPKETIQYSVSDYSGYYDGAAHSITLSVATEGVTVTYAESEDGEYSAANPSYTEPGTYTVWFRIEKEGYETVTDSASVTITELGTIQYSVSDYRGYYDGKAHSITLRVATEGVTVTYNTPENTAYTTENPAYTEFGMYLVGFKLEKAGYETVTGVAKVIIFSLRQIEYSVEGYSGDYDGQPHTISLNVATDGVAATYATSENGAYSTALPSFTEPDVYTVWFKLEKEGYETVTGSATVTIVALGKIKYTVDDYIGTYDGKPHSISLNVLTEGVDVTYSVNFIERKTLPTFTEPGSHTIHVKLEKEGYITAYDISCVKIDPGVIEYSARGYSGYADGKQHSIQLYVSTPDTKVSYATSKGGKYSATKPSFSGIGTHTVWYRIEKEHYETVEDFEVVKLRQPKEDSIVYSVEDYVGAYDGEAHTIALDVTTQDVKASYATSEKGAYGATLPTFTEPGTYTVWYKLEKSGYETSTGSATVTIEKAEQTLYFEQSIILINPLLGQSNYTIYWGDPKREKDGGTLSYSFSDPDRISYDGDMNFRVPYEEWCKGYTATITATAAETDHYKAATATCTVMASSRVKGDYAFDTGNDSAENTGNSQNQEMLLSTDLDLTLLPVTEQDGNRLSSLLDALRKKLMASAGSDQIGAMAVDAALTDKQTGEEIHSTTGDLTLSLTGSLVQSYQKDYKNMSCIAVHIKQDVTPLLTVNIGPDRNQVGQDSTAPAELDVKYNRDNTSNPTSESTVQSYDFTMSTYGATADSSIAPMPDSTPAPQDTNVGGAGVNSGSSGFTMAGGAIDTSGANEAGAGVYNDSSSFTMSGGNINAATTDNGNSSLIGNTGNGIGGGNSGESSNIQISGGIVSATGNTGNGIGGGSSGEGSSDEGSNIQISGGSVKDNAGTSAPSPNDPAGDPTGTQVYKTEVNLDGNNSSGADSNGSTNHIPGSLSLDDPDNSNEEQLLVQRDNQTIVPTGSLSPTVEFLPCELTESGVVIKDTSLSPFLLIYGPKEAFSKLLTVRAKDGVFIYDGEGHAVAAEPSIAEGTSLYYSLDLENWQTDAPAFTDVLWNEDGSVGSYQVYVLADNPDCDPAVCSYTVTILPAE